MKELKSARQIAKERADATAVSAESDAYPIDRLPRRLNWEDLVDLNGEQLAELEKAIWEEVAKRREAVSEAQKKVTVSTLSMVGRVAGGEFRDQPEYRALAEAERALREMLLNAEEVHQEIARRVPIPRVDLTEWMLNAANPNELHINTRKAAVAQMSSGMALAIRPPRNSDYKPMRVVCGWFRKDTGAPESARVSYEKEVEDEPDGRLSERMP